MVIIRVVFQNLQNTIVIDFRSSQRCGHNGRLIIRSQKIFTLRRPLNYWLYGRLHIPARKSRVLFSNHLNFKEMVGDFVQSIILNLLRPTIIWDRIFWLH